jgi:hypothetical protein
MTATPAHYAGMSEQRPPDVDAEYRLIRGPWPRWALQLSLVKLGLWTAAVVSVCLALFVGIALLILRG